MTSRSTVFKKQLAQTAILWINPTPDGYGGVTFNDGIDIKVRWEDKNELFVDQQGKTSTSRAQVFVDRDIAIGSYLMLGSVNDLASGTDEPFLNQTAYEVRSFDKVPDIRATKFTRSVWL